LNPRPPAPKALRGVRASTCEAVGVQVTRGRAGVRVQGSSPRSGLRWLPYWLPALWRARSQRQACPAPRPSGAGEQENWHDALVLRGLSRWCLSLALLFSCVACSDDDDGEAVDVTAACDRLEELADAILDAANASSTDEVRAAVQAPLVAFSAAAASSGDERLAELARTADESFTDYLADNGIDAREAGNEADIAIDRSAERCAQLGATSSFPTQP
jgi:hypothetical protein